MIILDFPSPSSKTKSFNEQQIFSTGAWGVLYLGQGLLEVSLGVGTKNIKIKQKESEELDY